MGRGGGEFVVEDFRELVKLGLVGLGVAKASQEVIRRRVKSRRIGRRRRGCYYCSNRRF